MSHDVARPPVRYLALELGADGIAEWSERRRAVFVPRDEVIELEVRHGIAGSRPFWKAALGLLLIAGGTFLTGALTGLWDLAFSRGAAPLAGASVPVVMLGLYIVWFATRPAPYLSVRTRRGVRSLLFHGEADLACVAETLRRAGACFGYRVRWTLEEPRPRTTPYRSRESVTEVRERNYGSR